MSLPELVLAGLLLFAPWMEGGATPGALALIHLAVLGLAAAVLARGSRSGGVELLSPWVLPAWALFTAWGAISFLRAEYRFGSFDTWWEQVILLVLAAALSALHPGDRFRCLLPVLIAGLGAAQAIPAVATRLTEGAALSPSFLNPNHLAAWLNAACLVALNAGGWLGRPGEALPKGIRLAWATAAAACLAGTIAVGSRGGLLALVAVLGFVAFRARARWPRAARLLAAVVLIVAAAGSASVLHRFASRSDPYRYDRPRLWMTAVRTWMESPILGHGPGMYEHRAPLRGFPQEAAVFRYSKQPGSAHSTPLQVLAEEGAPGLGLSLLVAATLLAALAGGLRDPLREPECRGALLAASVVGIHSLVEMPFQAPAIPIMLILLAWAALAPSGAREAALAIRLRWPRREEGPLARPAASAAALSILSLLALVGVAGPWLSDAAARYAASAGRPPVRIDIAARIAERFNPWQPFLGYRRAAAALRRSESISPALLANAMESLEKTIRLEPGDASARALLAELYRRAADGMPGAGPGAIAAAGRHHDRAVAIAPLDARLRIDRAAFRLATGRPDEALSDAVEASRLEPRSLTARHLEVEALAALGRKDEAIRALRELDALRANLAGYRPLNGYEAALLRLDVERVEGLRAGLLPSLLVPPS